MFWSLASTGSSIFISGEPGLLKSLPLTVAAKPVLPGWQRGLPGWIPHLHAGSVKWIQQPSSGSQLFCFASSGRAASSPVPRSFAAASSSPAKAPASSAQGFHQQLLTPPLTTPPDFLRSLLLVLGDYTLQFLLVRLVPPWCCLRGFEAITHFLEHLSTEHTPHLLLQLSPP